jgi:glutathione synthase
MGGTGVFRLRKDDPNIGTALETLTERYRRPVMAQTYLSAIRSGDKRVLLVDGEAVPYALARLPKSGETRANLATGGSYRAQPLTAGDRRIADRVAPTLVEYGLRFVGLDIIGEYLTEINVTSPTCIREIARGAGVDAAQLLMDALAADFALTDPQRA